MKIKSFKIKVENDIHEYAIPGFYALTNIIYSTNAEIIEINGEYFWLIVILFEPKANIIPGESRYERYKHLPNGFKEAVQKYVSSEKPKIRVKNCINCYLDDLLEVKTLEDFKRFRGIGKKSIFDESQFLTGLLEIIRSFQAN